MATTNITAAQIAALKYDAAGPSKQIPLWDRKVPGFGVRVLPSGATHFILKYRLKDQNGRNRLMGLGRTQDFRNVTEARERAADHMRAIRRDGADPLAEAERKKAAGTCKDLFTDWLDHVAKKCAPRTARDYRIFVERYLLREIGSRPPRDITRGDARRLHTKLTAKHGQVRANRIVQAARAAFGWELKEDSTTFPPHHSNVFKSVTFNRERPRDEYLRPGELSLVAREIETEPDPFARAYLWLLILTGCRGGELVKLRWADVNLAAATMTFRDTKNHRDFEVKLPEVAVQVLERMPRSGAHVFPPRRSDSKVQHMAKPRTAWDNALKRANIGRRITLHDCRRSIGTLLASRGFSAQQIAAQLNHKSDITARVYVMIVDNTRQQMADVLGAVVVQTVALPAPDAPGKAS